MQHRAFCHDRWRVGGRGGMRNRRRHKKFPIRRRSERIRPLNGVHAQCSCRHRSDAPAPRTLAFRAPRRTRHLRQPPAPEGSADDGRSPGLCRAGLRGINRAACGSGCLPGPLTGAGGMDLPARGGRPIADHAITYSCGGSDGLAADAAHRSSLFIPRGTPSCGKHRIIPVFFKP